MSRPSRSQSQTENPGVPATGAVPAKVPGRTVGFTIMTLTIVFAGYWMQREGAASMAVNQSDSNPASVTDYAGFDAQRWYLPDDALLGFVEIPAGEFTMGSNPVLDAMAYENERWSSSQRQGQVNLPGFYMARFEVTRDQFRLFRGETGATETAEASDLPGNLPVNNITWAESLAYTRWLDQQLRSSDATPQVLRDFLNRGGRITLPSEAEWEKAARGTDARIFPWGSEPTSQHGNFGGAGLLPAGSKTCPPCVYGLADMSGNVWEFTRSPLQDYPYDTADDFRNLAGEPLFVMRGGSYTESVNNVRAAVRGGVDPGARSPTIGFRLALSLQ